MVDYPVERAALQGGDNLMPTLGNCIGVETLELPTPLGTGRLAHLCGWVWQQARAGQGWMTGRRNGFKTLPQPVTPSPVGHTPPWVTLPRGHTPPWVTLWCFATTALFWGLILLALPLRAAMASVRRWQYGRCILRGVAEFPLPVCLSYFGFFFLWDEKKRGS